MDSSPFAGAASFSAADVARELGTSVPRVIRAAKRLGFDTRASTDERRRSTGRLHLTAAQTQRLYARLGCNAQVDGLSLTETAALAALARSPFGLPSARSVARAAGLSPTSTARAVASLTDQGLVIGEDTTLVSGRARTVHLLRANRRHPRYRTLTAAFAKVEPPEAQREEHVPAALKHLFWNTSPSQLEVAHGGEYIARRLLRTLDPAGLAWGARNLDAAHWRVAARARGLEPSVRALAENLAAAQQPKPDAAR